MKLSQAAFDSLLATGELRRKSPSHWAKTDPFGVRSLELPAPAPATFDSLDEAVASLMKATEPTKSK